MTIVTNIMTCTTKLKEQRLVSNDMDVNEHERLSNITQNLGKEQCFNYSSSFHNHYIHIIAY
jgi:hypothetical protein